MAVDAQGNPIPEPAQNTQTAETHVENAETQVQQAAQAAPNAEIGEALKGIKVALDDILVELRKAPEQAKEVAPQTEQAAEPVVSTPAKSERYVRRYGRKVKR